jgi:hypothetical protein
MIEKTVVKDGDGSVAPKALVASAVRMPGDVSRVYRKNADWQGEAWRHYDNCGELRYASNWQANVLSRATLHAAKRTPEGILASKEGPAVDAMVDLFDGPDGQSQMLSAIGLHLFVAGECYLVGRKPDPTRSERGAEDIWEIVGTEEMKHRGRRWSIDYGDGKPPLELGDDAVILRIWRPHPRKRIEADSPVRAVIGILSELEYLSRHIMAQITSRLAGAGLLMLPSSISFPTPPAGSNLPEGANSADIFMATLGESMMTPIKDPGDPSAIVPIVVTAADDAIDKTKHITFWSELNGTAIEMRTEAIRRLALGLDMPPEVLLGTANLNHWGAWQMDESSIKAHTEPLLELITNALTIGYLQPITEDPDDVVAYDTSALRLRPNRSKEAVELYDRGELDGEALRRETGFSEDDAPSADEFKNWMLRKVASGSTTPEQVADALVALGVLGIRAESTTPPTEGRPAPSLVEHPDYGPPDQQAASLYAMSEVLVYRALERAGNRLRSLKQVRPACSAADTYLLLPTQPGELDRVMEDAWGCIPRVLPLLPEYQRNVVTKALDAYTRYLLVEQKPHTRDAMVRFLDTTTLRTLE